MGKVKPDLAGAYVSKVGGVAYYIKDGVNYVRSLSKSGYKSNTPLQAGVKARFKSASQMAGQMKEIAKVGFPQRKRGLTPKNAWHSANKDCFRKTDEGIEIDFEKLQFSNGNLYPTIKNQRPIQQAIRRCRQKATAIRMMLCMCCFWIPNSCLRVWCQ